MVYISNNYYYNKGVVLVSENKIHAAHHNISEIILSKNIKYLIPDFQRDFVWGEKEIESLIDYFAC